MVEILIFWVKQKMLVHGMTEPGQLSCRAHTCQLELIQPYGKGWQLIRAAMFKVERSETQSMSNEAVKSNLVEGCSSELAMTQLDRYTC